MIIYLVIATCLLLLYVGCVRQVTPFWVTFAFLAVVGIGFERLSAEGFAPYEDVVLDAISLASIVIGYVAARVVFRSVVRTEPTLVDKGTPFGPFPDGIDVGEDIQGRLEFRRLLAVSAVISGFVVFHFVEVGLPIFSSDVEIVRWNFAAGGIFGLPGRAYLYGLPVMYVLCELVRRQYPASRQMKYLSWFILAELVITRIVGGFKGQLLDVVIYLVLIRLSDRRIWRLSTTIKKYLVPVALALVFAAFVATLYQSVNNSNEPTYQVIGNRVTTGAALPGETALSMRRSNNVTHLTVFSDLDIYTKSLLGAPPNDRYLFIKQVSATLNHRSLSGSGNSPQNFIVPTTPGAFPVLYYDFGKWAMLAMFLLGACYALIEGWALNAKGLLGAFIATVGILILQESITKGDFATVPINWLAITFLVWILWGISGFILSDRMIDGRQKVGHGFALPISSRSHTNGSFS